jgi:hypothetical protein
MALVVVYTRRDKKKQEATCADARELGIFVYMNQPIQIIAVREERA